MCIYISYIKYKKVKEILYKSELSCFVYIYKAQQREKNTLIVQYINYTLYIYIYIYIYIQD